MVRWSSIVSICIVLSVATARGQTGQTTAFTYQGQLSSAGQPATGSYDLQFALFGVASGGAPIGSTQTVTAVPVSNGVFTVQLDFGVSAFPGADRYLEIGVRPAGTGSYITLAPRQQISSTPYAIRTLSAMTADALSSACVGCVTNAQIASVAGSKVTGTIPTTSLPTGSGNYIQNSTAPQVGANFNISGNGTVGGNLTVTGTLNANVSGNFIQNRTTPQSNANFDVSGNGSVGGTLSAGDLAAGPPAQLTPQLDVDGTGWFRGDSTPLTGHGKGLAAGLGGAGGYVFAFDYGAETPLNLLLNNPGGNVGIGTITPVARLEVTTGTGPGDGVHGTSTGGRGVWGDSSTYQGVYGHSVSNAGVVGESDKFDAVFATSHDPNNSGVIAFNDNSGFGVTGITNAAHTSTKAGVYGQSTGTGGVGVIGQADSGNAWGVYGTSASPTGVGVVGNATGGGWAMAATGNTTQTISSGGWVKAMVHVQQDGTIDRCYNSQAQKPTTGRCNSDSVFCQGICGYTLGGDPGQYRIDFGFPVSDRFFAVFPEVAGSYIGANGFGFSDPDSLTVVTFYTAEHGGSSTYASFYLVVF